MVEKRGKNWRIAMPVFEQTGGIEQKIVSASWLGRQSRQRSAPAKKLERAVSLAMSKNGMIR